MKRLRVPLRHALLSLGLIGLCATTAAQTPPPGRLLASNCFQCHGTNGKGPGFDKIAGESPDEIYKKLREFQSGKEGNEIMARHAMGYSDSQMRALSAWLSTQR